MGIVVDMGIFNYVFLLVVGFFALISAGCSDNPDGKSTTAAASSVSNSHPTPATATQQATATPRTTAGDPQSPPAETKEELAKAAFEYPFPDREFLFLPPAKKPATSDIRSEDDEDVVLMGFADVGGARAVLKIDGIVTPLRVGESRGDVRVLAINPPKVNLQRGKHQWTASLAEIP